MRGALATLLVFAVPVACSVEVDIADKGCPCAAGYVCDSARNLCVPPALARAICGDDCPCTTNAECPDRDRSVCSPELKKCVECDPKAATSACKEGSFCNEQSECILGCRGDSDCRADAAKARCAVTRAQCVACLTDADCAGRKCSPGGACVEGCERGCKAGEECCDGLCLDLMTDTFNCGACGNRCVSVKGAARCTAGRCAWECQSGYGHCADGNTGCETDLRTDPAHCGACSNTCRLANANQKCVLGGCVVDSCKQGFADFDAVSANGCEEGCGGFGGGPSQCCPGTDRCAPGTSCKGAGGPNRGNCN